jgi:membrane-associated PAP2 superfamily phosphatase
MASPVIGAAALPIAVLERAAELDCPWLVAMDRAEQAGKLLAAVLLKNRHASEESCGGKL